MVTCEEQWTMNKIESVKIHNLFLNIFDVGKTFLQLQCKRYVVFFNAWN